MKGGLQVGNKAGFGQALDRLDLAPGSLNREHQAAVNRLAVKQHEASAAYAHFASEMRAGQLQLVPKEIGKARAGLDEFRNVVAIDAQLEWNVHHASRPHRTVRGRDACGVTGGQRRCMAVRPLASRACERRSAGRYPANDGVIFAPFQAKSASIQQLTDWLQMTRATPPRKEKDQLVISDAVSLDTAPGAMAPERTAPKPRRKNMRSEDREKQILEEAVRFFAECGFEGQTRELATRLGVSHAVIYRHFESKEQLIERVYEHVYTSRWRSAWDSLMTVRSRPLEDRLLEFYREYVDCVFEYEWVRIFISAGLKSYDLPSRYLTIVRDRILRPAIAEMRHELNLAEAPPTEIEEELFWGLHGGVFYVAIRKFIYGSNVPDGIADTVARTVKASLTGIRAHMADAGARPVS